jgi:integrase
MQGVTPKRIQVLMGHASIRLTFDLYGALWTDADKDRTDAAKVEAALFG